MPAPLIDPDLLDQDQFAAVNNDNPAFTLWAARQETLQLLFKLLASDKQNLKGLEDCLTDGDIYNDEIAFHSLGFTPAVLDEMAQARERDEAYPTDPLAYGLTRREMATLLEVRKLAKAKLADTTDWANATHILIQAEKRRHLYPTWREAEQRSSLNLSPDYFRLPTRRFAQFLPPDSEPRPGIEWRVDATAKRAWRNKLKARLDQQSSLIEGFYSTIDQVEEAVLPGLRDALVQVVQPDPGTLADKKVAITNRLLINAAENGTRKTSRVAQAIEAMQLLLWGIRTGQIEDHSLSLDNTQAFDEEWKWLGAYGNWRAAMFVFLYPENLLQPQLRPDEEQTTLFKAFVKVLAGWAPMQNTENHDENGEEVATENEVDRLAKLIYERLDRSPALSRKGLEKLWKNLGDFSFRFSAGDYGAKKRSRPAR